MSIDKGSSSGGSCLRREQDERNEEFKFIAA